MNYYFAAFKKYAVFSGRAQRAEYWYFVLFNIVVTVAISAISAIIGFVASNMLGLAIGGLIDSFIKFVVTLLYCLAVFIPGLAVAVRRLHDVGKNGWMLLIALIPIIGAIWLIVLLATDSNPGENKYGPNPKGVAAAGTVTV
ncbi:MAG: DUF805 domain-containing protein [Candidatus Wolfebacteria bacterium]|nr:DUF805 domain-containing protein [Candidatus Wolfebacteria bacterium]